MSQYAGRCYHPRDGRIEYGECENCEKVINLEGINRICPYCRSDKGFKNRNYTRGTAIYDRETKPESWV